MGNNAAVGHVVANVGLAQAAGFHKTLGQMMYQYGIQPWDPKAPLMPFLQRQQQLQQSSPLRFINVKEGLSFYSQQVGSFMNILNREKFVQLSLQLFQQRQLTLPVEEAKQFYDIFDSIDLYKNAQLSIGELAGGLSSFFGGTVQDKTDAVFDCLSGRSDNIPKSALQELIKPYIWCMVPQNAEVLRPVLLPHVTQEVYNDMTFQDNGYISRQELNRWSQKGLLSQGQVNPQNANMGQAIVDRVALIVQIAVQTAHHEYEHKYALQDYGKETYQQNYGGNQQIYDVGALRYGQQVGGQMATGVAGAGRTAYAASPGVFAQAQTVGGGVAETFGAGIAQLGGWFNDAMGGRRGSIESIDLARTRTYSVGGPQIVGTTRIRAPTETSVVVQPAMPAPVVQQTIAPAPQAPPAPQALAATPQNLSNVPPMAAPQIPQLAGLANLAPQQPPMSARGAYESARGAPQAFAQPGLQATMQPGMAGLQQPNLFAARPGMPAMQPTMQGYQMRR